MLVAKGVRIVGLKALLFIMSRLWPKQGPIFLLIFLSDTLSSMYVFDTSLLLWSQTAPWNFNRPLVGGKLATLNGMVLLCGDSNGEILIQLRSHCALEIFAAFVLSFSFSDDCVINNSVFKRIRNHSGCNSIRSIATRMVTAH